jgi:hypothetical protein
VDGPGLKAHFLLAMAFPRAEARGFYRRAACAAPQAWFVFASCGAAKTGVAEISTDGPGLKALF